jgi:hypothetical protein
MVDFTLIGAAFDFGAAAILACPILLWCFNRMTTIIPGTT